MPKKDWLLNCNSSEICEIVNEGLANKILASIITMLSINCDVVFPETSFNTFDKYPGVTNKVSA